MEPFRYHVFVCTETKPEGVPCCRQRGSLETLAALRREIQARGLEDEVQVTTCGSLGLCETGPNMVVYPEGIWYSSVLPSDIPVIVEQHFLQRRPVEALARIDPAELRAEMLANREKRLAGMRAREASGAVPDDFLARILGFQESRIILSALELDVFTAIGSGATAAQVADRIHSDPRATEMLLNALAAMEMLAKDGDTFRNTPIAARFLGDQPGSARLSFLHTANMWHNWSTLTESVKAGTAVALDRSTNWTQSFIAAMHRNALGRASRLLQAVDASRIHRMLDVGGGSGAYSIAFAQANPHLQADVLDLASVLPITQSHIDAAGLTGRIHTRVGDLTSDDLGHGYDLILLSAICHMLSPEQNRDLFARASRAVTPGGRLVVQDFLLEPCKTAPKSAALFSINMLVATAAGASYSEPEYREWLAGAGFASVYRPEIPGPAGLLIATINSRAG